ncbi:unnamed protein product [Parajaminaea phylloscopi]
MMGLRCVGKDQGREGTRIAGPGDETHVQARVEVDRPAGVPAAKLSDSTESHRMSGPGSHSPFNSNKQFSGKRERRETRRSEGERRCLRSCEVRACTVRERSEWSVRASQGGDATEFQ